MAEEILWTMSLMLDTVPFLTLCQKHCIGGARILSSSNRISDRLGDDSVPVCNWNDSHLEVSSNKEFTTHFADECGIERA